MFFVVPAAQFGHRDNKSIMSYTPDKFLRELAITEEDISGVRMLYRIVQSRKFKEGQKLKAGPGVVRGGIQWRIFTKNPRRLLSGAGQIPEGV